MAKKPGRTWTLVVSLGIPLLIVGTSAMAISYATLIDVARVHGLPIPELFPILIDVGTVTTMIAAAQFRLRGVNGRWLAYTTFTLLSGVSIMANSMHAWNAADLTRTSAPIAGLLAATPPTVLLAITHLVMKLIPDEKERAKLQAAHKTVPVKTRTSPVQVENLPAAPVVDSVPDTAGLPLRLVDEKSVQPVPAGKENVVEKEATAKVLNHFRVYGHKPTGAEVGQWLGGKSAKTGQRFLVKLEAANLFPPKVSVNAQPVIGNL